MRLYLEKIRVANFTLAASGIVGKERFCEVRHAIEDECAKANMPLFAGSDDCDDVNDCYTDRELMSRHEPDYQDRVLNIALKVSERIGVELEFGSIWNPDLQ